MNIYQLINGFFDLLYLMLMIRILMSWIPHDRSNGIISILYDVTDPIMKPFQQILPPTAGFDFSPILAFIFLNILKTVIFRLI
tara:strand:- start:1863 stop:2111 length:249 start_codon:yes stop_codon:yes gene_type:complete